MNFLIEIDGPGADKPVPGETSIEFQVEHYVRGILKHNRLPFNKVTVHQLPPDTVTVNADALLRLQEKAKVFDAIEERRKRKFPSPIV